jgi:hypothetical protein
MSTQSWTPGPWKYSKSHGDIISMNHSPDDIVCDTAARDNPKYFVRGRDAQLISTAPELYEAVELAIEWIEAHAMDKPESNETVSALVSVAEKARGES